MIRYMTTALLLILTPAIPSTANHMPAHAIVRDIEAEYCDTNLRVNRRQALTIHHAIIAGDEYDLGYSLAAISGVESEYGKYLLNLADPSFGPFAIHIKTASKRRNINPQSFTANLLAHELITNPELGAELAIEELLFWQSIHGPDPKKIHASYNAGHNYVHGAKYADMVMDEMKLIRQCYPNIKAKYNMHSTTKSTCAGRFCSANI